MINSLKIKNVKVKKVKKAINFNLEENAIEKPYYYAIKTGTIIPSNLKVKRLYCEKGNIFFYTEDGYMYRLINNAVSFLTDIEFIEMPKVVAVKINGREDLLIFNEEVAEFNNYGIPFTLEYTNVYLVIEDVFFATRENELKVFRMTLTSFDGSGIENLFSFKGKSEDGKIVDIKEYGGDVLVLFEHKLVTLSFKKDPLDIVVDKVLTPYIFAKENTLKICGDKAVFISENKLAIYKKGNLSFVNLPSIANVFNYASSNGSIYTVPFSKGSEECLLVYDVEENLLSELKLNGKTISKDGALIVDSLGEIMQIERGVIKSESVSDDGVSTGLDDCFKKVLTLIEIHAVGSATLKVLTSFTEKEYEIKSGCNRINTNLCDREFTFKFKDKSEDFCPLKATVTYIKLGE